MSEMIERVARGIFASQEWPEFHPAYEVSSEIFEIAARAAIEAMREPTQAMLQEGASGSGEDSEATALGAWETMIDAALQEKEAGENPSATNPERTDTAVDNMKGKRG